MKITRITTEDPQSDQWKMLSQFAYPLNISRYFDQNNISNFTNETLEFIAGCIRQAQAYFVMAKQSPIDISPLLIYYGASNLLLGIGALIQGVKPTVNNHGMKLIVPLKENVKIADVAIQPIEPSRGALQYLCNAFSDGCNISVGETWTLEEVFGSIPDLRTDFELYYQSGFHYTLPIEVVRDGKIIIDRISPVEMSKYTDPAQVLSRIHRLSQSYLTPQYGGTEKHTILNRRLNYTDIGEYSLFGSKFLMVSHLKKGVELSPNQLIILYMGLYALGYLSRYRPEIWNPFIRTDATGERLFVEKFLSLCLRYIPNLVLNKIYKSRIQFVYDIASSSII